MNVVSQEKDRKVKILEEIAKLRGGGIYSVEDIASLRSGLVDATSWITLPGRYNPLSGAEPVADFINARYARTKEVEDLLWDLLGAESKGTSLELDKTDLDERVDSAINKIITRFSDPQLHQQDLRELEVKLQNKKLGVNVAGGMLGFFAGAILSLPYLGLMYIRKLLPVANTRY